MDKVRDGMRVLFFGLVLVVAGSRGVEAQMQTPVELGAWMQTALSCGASESPTLGSCAAVGTLVPLSLTTPTPDGKGPHSTFDINALTALQLRRERTSHARRGAVLGALVGGIGTYLLLNQGASTSLCDRSANQDAIGRRECIGLTVLGTMAGTTLGAWVGGRFRVER